jgi:hypothetical protein
MKPPKPKPSFKVKGYTGNIDLFKRPKVKNADGTISTLLSFSFQDPHTNKEVLIPRVGIINGRAGIMPERKAIDTYYATGKHLGVFNTPEEATAMAEFLHKQQQQYYSK